MGWTMLFSTSFFCAAHGLSVYLSLYWSQLSRLFPPEYQFNVALFVETGLHALSKNRPRTSGSPPTSTSTSTASIQSIDGITISSRLIVTTGSSYRDQSLKSKIKVD
ncbi:5132_t:CDS:2, partial [Acaulospora colombiana]